MVRVLFYLIVFLFKNPQMHYILSDFGKTADFYPLTLSRPIALLRFGIDTIDEKWRSFLPEGIWSYQTASHLSAFYAEAPSTTEAVIINAAVIPSDTLVSAILNLKIGERLVSGTQTIAAYRPSHFSEDLQELKAVAFDQDPVIALTHITDLFSKLNQLFQADYLRLTAGLESEPLHPTNTVIGKYPVFLAPGASAYASIFNTEAGPIYLDRGAHIMEGSIIRGPVAIGAHSTLKMGAKLYGPTVIGHHCKVGGEVSNVVFDSYTNKGHEGFVGNSVLGQWCNLGADTNTSNLKNNYDQVKLYSYTTKRFEPTGLQFCGLIMGDHSKSGINTMFNTGTVVGFSSNLFGAGYIRNFVTNFTWGGPQGTSIYLLDKAKETAERVMARRDVAFDNRQHELFQAIYDLTVSGDEGK